jgi:hypothetical protein
MLKVKNWEKFQHYKGVETLKWIKLHCDLLNNFEFESLDELTQLHLIKLWLLAARNNGQINGTPEWLATKIGAKTVNIGLMVSTGFLIPDDSRETLEQLYSNSRVPLDKLYRNSRETLESIEESRGEESTLPPPPPKPKKQKAKGRSPVVFPPSLDTPEFAEAWADWEAFRREKRKYLTDTSVNKQLAMLETFGVEGAIASIEQSITNGWQGLFEPKGGAAPRQDADENPFGQTREFDATAPDVLEELFGDDPNFNREAFGLPPKPATGAGQ